MVYTDEFAELFKGFHEMNETIIQREKFNKQLLDSFMMVLSTTLNAETNTPQAIQIGLPSIRS